MLKYIKKKVIVNNTDICKNITKNLKNKKMTISPLTRLRLIKALTSRSDR